MDPAVLVTGGAGYVGTHVLLALANSGRKSVCLDNYSNSSPRAIDRLNAIVRMPVEAVNLDIGDQSGLRTLLREHLIDSVVHLAGLKSVAESVERPELYYRNNVEGTRRMLEVLGESSVRTLVFSSSACVYAMRREQPLDEEAPLGPYNPYGESKLEIERLLAETARKDRSWRIATLRYFNPVGAHSSGQIGEDPKGVPSNLMPYLCQVATGSRPKLSIFGADYPTKDGTGVRDYIHVMDLAEGHLAALATISAARRGVTMTVNLGTGRGLSVLEVVAAFERVNQVRIPRDFAPRRPGDIAEYYADASTAQKTLRWTAQRGIEEMCRDAWNWQRNNPNGYEG